MVLNVQKNFKASLKLPGCGVSTEATKFCSNSPSTCYYTPFLTIFPSMTCSPSVKGALLSLYVI